MYAFKLEGSTYDVQILLANSAIAEHNSLDFSPNAVHRCLQQRASMPEGPAEPSVSGADLRIASVVMLSTRQDGSHY